MKRISPLTLAIIYMALGALFIIMSIQTVSRSGWGFFAYFLVLLATLDLGSGIRMLLLHFKIKSIQKKNKK